MKKQNIIKQIKLWKLASRNNFEKFKTAKEHYDYWVNELIVLEEKK